MIRAGDEPSPARSGQVDETEAKALQTVLAAAHAAVYAYALIGAKGQGGTRRRAVERLDRLTERRDRLAGRVSNSGRRPDPPAAGYALPFEVRSETSLRALARQVEQALAAADADLVAGAAPGRRLEAADWLAEDSVAAAAWGSDDEPFPGLPERSTR